MIFPTMYGACWNLIYPAAKVPGEDEQGIIGYSFMPYSKFFAPGHHGETCQATMVIGKIPIDVFVVGVIEGYGRRCWNTWWRPPILNG